jgi:2-polyprenyl-3-methyl-5-hydroxy-6-metoxy-1,4-benzoquinol methylase
VYYCVKELTMSEKEWFINWFDSEYYHLLYNNRNEAEAESFIEQFVEYLKVPEQSKVLDVACGKGRHSKTLARLGFDVTGIDLSANSISAAKKFETDTLHFDVWDMRKTYRESYFDVTMNLFSSFGYLPTDEDNLIALKAIASNLKPDGKLVLDYLNAEAIIKEMKPREIIQRGEIQFHIQKKIENGFIKKTIEFIDENGTAHEYTEQLRIIKPETFAGLFQSSGLKIDKVFGSYALEDFSSGKSLRQIIVATKI